MTWSDTQRAEIAREYQRVGYKEGELWPAPPEDLKPAEIIALFRRISDGAGRDGYSAELAKIAKQ
jgi:hypothetical protein